MVWLQRSWIWLLNFWLFIRISPTKKRKLCRLFSAFQVRNKVHFREACQKAWSEIGSRTKPSGRWMDGKRWRGRMQQRGTKRCWVSNFVFFSYRHIHRDKRHDISLTNVFLYSKIIQKGDSPYASSWPNDQMKEWWTTYSDPKTW